ncbi:astakine-like [Limulus polyphemus]|uniref:Astakine-like n=1 Tax=Limulus polyphemus TaxID=6850 RepID=A0ABM1B808_LIMPO|nr:astakine-like [Limulus polyphemus]
MKTIVCVFLILLELQVILSFPGFDGCRSPQDCDKSSCCVITMEKYSVPHCRKLGNKEEYCRTRNSAQNMTLNYPNGSVDVFGVYRILCPCNDGLECVQSVCQLLHSDTIL